MVTGHPLSLPRSLSLTFKQNIFSIFLLLISLNVRKGKGREGWTHYTRSYLFITAGRKLWVYMREIWCPFSTRCNEGSVAVNPRLERITSAGPKNKSEYKMTGWCVILSVSYLHHPSLYWVIIVSVLVSFIIMQLLLNMGWINRWR